MSTMAFHSATLVLVAVVGQVYGAQDPTAMEEELECPICYEILTQPQTAECKHTFCKTCLDEYLLSEKRENPGILKPPCPKCRKPLTNIGDVSYVLRSVIANFKAQKQEPDSPAEPSVNVAEPPCPASDNLNPSPFNENDEARQAPPKDEDDTLLAELIKCLRSDTFKVGEKVEAWFKTEHVFQWYPGVVHKVNDNQTYQITWDGGVTTTLPDHKGPRGLRTRVDLEHLTDDQKAKIVQMKQLRGPFGSRDCMLGIVARASFHDISGGELE